MSDHLNPVITHPAGERWLSILRPASLLPMLPPDYQPEPEAGTGSLKIVSLYPSRVLHMLTIGRNKNTLNAYNTNMISAASAGRLSRCLNSIHSTPHTLVGEDLSLARVVYHYRYSPTLAAWTGEGE